MNCHWEEDGRHLERCENADKKMSIMIVWREAFFGLPGGIR
jgi:hypothetical protein